MKYGLAMEFAMMVIMVSGLTVMNLTLTAVIVAVEMKLLVIMILKKYIQLI